MEILTALMIHVPQYATLAVSLVTLLIVINSLMERIDILEGKLDDVRGEVCKNEDKSYHD